MLAASALFGVPVVGGHTARVQGPSMLAVAVLGRAKRLISSHAAKPGQKLIMAVDLRGSFRGPGGAFNAATTASAQQLRAGLALLPELYLPPSGFLVSPVLAFWREPGAVRPVDPAETAVVARVPVADLVDPANRGQVHHPSGYTGPAFQVADLLVWGFTAGLVDALLELGGCAGPWARNRVYELPTLP
jgi:hypothetical protein